MKFALTITDATPSELSALLLALNGSTAPFVATMQAAAVNGDDETGDDNGPVNPNAPAVDGNGLPWDARIHSGNKEMTDKGVWRKRRGVSKETIAAVEAELRKTAAAPVPMQAPQPQPVPMQPPAPAATMPMPAPQPAPMQYQPQPAPQPAPMQYQPQPAPMPAPQPAPMQPPAPVAAPAMDFPTFMQALSGQMQKRDASGMPLIDTDYLARVTAEVGTAFGTPLGVITDIVSQQRAAEMIVYAVQCMQRDGKWN